MHFDAKRTAGLSNTLERRFLSIDLHMISPAGSSSTCLDQTLTCPWKQSCGTQASPHRVPDPSPVLLQGARENFKPSPSPSSSGDCRIICFGAFRKNVREKALLDWIYLHRQEGSTINTDELDLQPLDRSKLLQYAAQFPLPVKQQIVEALAIFNSVQIHR